jgi:hypothetical protein
MTIFRLHLARTIKLKLPKNTLRKSWVSYALKIDKEGMGSVSDQAGHSSAIEVKFYRNSRAKPSAARAWFAITPDLLANYLAERLVAAHKAESLRAVLEMAPVEMINGRMTVRLSKAEAAEAMAEEA